jgi:hypothetical protein
MIFSKKDMMFLSLLIGIPFVISALFLLIRGFSDYLLLSIVFIIGILFLIAGSFIYRDLKN